MSSTDCTACDNGSGDIFEETIVWRDPPASCNA